MVGQTDISPEADSRWELAAHLTGILGILCGIWAFIWGWMKSSTLGLKKIMMLWSVCFGLSIVGNVIYGGAMVAKIQSGEIQMPQNIPVPAP